MKYRIRYSNQSRRDLDEIWDYIATELQNTPAAVRIVNAIMDSVDQLIDFAEMGAPLSSIANVESDYRFLVHGNYLTFYRVQETRSMWIAYSMAAGIICVSCSEMFWKKK